MFAARLYPPPVRCVIGALVLPRADALSRLTTVHACSQASGGEALQVRTLLPSRFQK